jgi:hypothetical protein
MEKVSLLVRLFPYLALLWAGIFSILEVIFPSLRNPDLNRWEIDQDSGPYIQIMGWKKMLRPPRVIAQGYMSDTAACAVALIVGIICILIGVLGIRHVSGFPGFFPDLFERL